jgi:wyosine [tRNA(Phe)-imidazoG37] synthetase (radical SAM superfamily)
MGVRLSEHSPLLRKGFPPNTAEFLIELQVAAFIKKQLQTLLTLVQLEVDEQPIEVDAFHFNAVSKKTKEHNIISSYSQFKDTPRFEPRIELIALQLNSILKLVQIEAQKQPLEVQSFRLRNLNEWLTSQQSNPYHGDPYYDVLKYMSWPCKADCVFCLHKGDPPGYYTKSESWQTSLQEVFTRLKYFSPNLGKALFSTMDYNSYEILTHPNILQVLRQIREKTEGIISFTTNGVALDEAMIQQLASLQPLFLIISLNSANPDTRRTFMRDQHPEIAINSLPLLMQQRIPYAISLVPWPEVPFEDVAYTIRFADTYKPYLIRVNLPSYTRYSPPSHRVPVHYWRKVVEFVREVRKEISTPILLQPLLYEENLSGRNKNRVEIAGVIQNSPAVRAGLQKGDEILAINGIPVYSRPQARDLLYICLEKGTETVSLRVRRGHKEFSVRMHEVCSDYGESYPYFSPLELEISPPHFRKIFHPYGLIILGGE